MKTKKFSFLALFLWILIFQMISTEDMCPNGMRKTYLDETTALEEGAARNYIPAINFYEGNGALWYRRKVLIEPRFEVHLKASIEGADYLESNREVALEGFTIVISKNKNRLTEGTADYIGYYGFTKSYVVEFDFDKTLNDPDSSSYSFKYCDSDCSNDDSKAIISGRLNSQRFDPSRTNNWDFRLVYVDKKLFLYSGPNDVIFTYNVDLYKMLQANTAYIGFTGYMHGNRREVNVLGTFICEDNFDITRMVGKFYVDDQTYDTYTYRAGETVQYLFSFINNKGQVIPHCFKQGIWSYSFSLSLDCDASNIQIRMKDEYNLFLSMNACNDIGTHKISVVETNHGKGPSNNYNIVGGLLKKITLIGHDGIITNPDTFSRASNGVRTLTYGAAEGSFPLKGGSLSIVLDFDMTDMFGNIADIGTTSKEMLRYSGFTLSTKNAASLEMKQADKHFQLIVTVTQTGTFRINKNSYMSEAIVFTVIVGGISSTDSYCTLEGYTDTPTLQKGDTAHYSCYFKDKKGNLVDTKAFLALEDYDFSCQALVSPSKNIYSTVIEDKTSHYDCAVNLNEPGVYVFSGYLTPRGQYNDKAEITPRVNKAIVLSNDFQLLYGNIYDNYKRNWAKIDNGVVIGYRPENDGLITLLDLVDADGKTLMSTYGKYPDNFDVSRIKVLLTNNHDLTYKFGELETRKYKLNGVEYIGVYTKGGVPTDSVIKKSSFEYTLKFIYNKMDNTVETRTVLLRYYLNLPGYKTCFHDLDLDKTTFDMKEKVFAGQYEIKLGKLELRTNDGYLYNYDIGKDNIKVLLDNDRQANYRVVPLSVAGTYDVYATIDRGYSGQVKVLVKDKVVGIASAYTSQGEACYLKFNEPELFEHIEDRHQEHFYEYVGECPDGNLEYFFTILDRYYNTILKSDYFDTFADIYSHSYGNDMDKFAVGFNTSVMSFQFRDVLQFVTKRYTWVFFMRDGTCNNKYYITYDGTKRRSTFSLKYSYYTLLQNEVYVEEYSYVDVFLKDSSNAFMGTNNNLNDLKEFVIVKALDPETNEEFVYDFDQVTGNYGIRFKYQCFIPGKYQVKAYFKTYGLNVQGSDILIVTLPRFSLEHSRLQMVTDSIIDMFPNQVYTVRNAVQTPFYNLLLYTANGDRTTYSDSDVFTCVMSGDDGVKMDLNVNKINDFIQFTYKDSDLEQFRKLKGNYKLTVTANGKGKEYQLLLVGDGNNGASSTDDYDLSKTYVYPTHIDGYAGEVYDVNVEFRTKDGLRWDNLGNTNLFTFKNSYGLDDENFITSVDYGYKKGQFIVHVQQNKITDKGDNIMTLIYGGEEIPQTVSLNIKAGDFAKLVLVDGPTPGNVINHPILTFEPQDSYGNRYYFDPNVGKDFLNSLTTGRSLDGVSLTTNNWLTPDGLLKVQYKTTISTNVAVTSPYFEEPDIPINYRIKSGPIDPNTSYAEMKSTVGLAAGSNYTIAIYPKDLYLNDIDDLNEDDMKNFYPYYEMVDNGNKINVTDCKLVEGYSSAIDIVIRKLVETETDYDSIECTTPISYIGNIAFHVDYKEDEIECRNCVFSVIASQFDFDNTKTYYKNREYYMSLEEINEIDAKQEPKWEITFYDQFNNLITDNKFVAGLNILTDWVGADIKLCVSTSGNKKISTLCPSTNGDDNINKWQYLVDGDHYKLVVREKDVEKHKLVYPCRIVGGGKNNTSNDPVDYDQTVFNPTTIKIKAGDEDKTTMELRTKDGKRKNYWFPDINDKIKVEFNEDKDACSYHVERGLLAGQYDIYVSCTKANDNNGFKVTVDGNPVDQNIELIVTPNLAYYLEVTEPDKFIASGNKYTWKVMPTNDDEPNFLFKLLDKYRNYITTSVLGTNQITIESSKFGKNQNYYDIVFLDPTIEYNFTDKINQPLNDKHVWDIVCTESGNKYSFIYKRRPGKVDPSKSFWEIDKTHYIVKETSTVWVTLNDRFGVNVGTEEGRLDQEKEFVTVITNKDKDIPYVYDTVTNDLRLQYVYPYQEIGKYVVSVAYDGIQIGDKKDVIVTYPESDMKNNKLYINQGDNKETLMSPTVATNINNKEVCPTYNYYFYTKDGEKITLFDKSMETKATLIYGKDKDMNWELDVDKKSDHLFLTHKDCNEFSRLPQGPYDLEVEVDDKKETYPIHLIGNNDTSVYQVEDENRTYVEPTYILARAGHEYQVNVEFRGKDDLRWNYEINPNLFEIENTYGLNKTQLVIRKVAGPLSGQLTFYVTQYVATTGKNDNILMLSYDGKKIPQTVTLHVICDDELWRLEYDSGAVDGTVIDPSIVKFIPVDKYGNLYTDLFNETLYPQEKLDALTKGKSLEGYPLTTNNWVDGKFLNVQYGSHKVTTIDLTSDYNPNTYRYKLWSGPIDPETTWAEMEKRDKVVAGDNNKMTVYPRDKYENNVTNATLADLRRFDIGYTVDDDKKNDILDTCDLYNFDTEDFDCNAKVTKAGNVKFTVDYDDQPVRCINCEFYISPGPIDFSKTKTYNRNENNKEMSQTEYNILSSQVNPHFLLKFFDKYLNPIVNQTEIDELPIATQFMVTDVDLCVTNDVLSKLSDLCPTDNNLNEEKWHYLPNGKDYRLIVIKTDNNETLVYPCELIDGYESEDGPEAGPVDSVYLNPTELTLVAGEEDTVFMELRTQNGKRKNFWYPDTEESVKVQFPKDVDDCTYRVERAEKPGQYNINFKCYKTRDPFPATVSLEGKEVPQRITLTVVPGAPYKSRLFFENGTEIVTPDLGTCSVDDEFRMIERLYDEYDNQITNIDFNLALLGIKMTPVNVNKTKNHKWSAEPSAQFDGDVLITLQSTLADKHVVVGTYFPLEQYFIVFTPGEADADNSLLEVSHTERYVGEPVKIFITPYDKYNNYIDAMRYKDETPYQVKYTNEGDPLKVIMTKYDVEERNGLNVLSYPGAFYVKGTTHVYGYIDDAPIKCVTCRILIKARDIDTYKAFRYDTNKQKFDPLRNGTVEKNKVEEPIYRLYPKDEYGNDIDTIPEEVLKKLTAHLKNQKESTVYNLKLNNNKTKDQSYAEFVINDEENKVPYSELVSGWYDLIFTDGNIYLPFNISLEGDGSVSTNEPADIPYTALVDEDLKYVAGNYGWMLLELRTADGVRHNGWDGYEFKIESCDDEDKSFGFTQQRAGTPGVFYITVTSTKSNTYPKLKECPLKVYVNDELVKDLHPLMEVYPDEVVRTEILQPYWKDGKNSSVLKDGYADKDYVFEVASYDQYGNLAETVQEVVGIKVNYQGGDEYKTESATNKETGYRKYVLQPRKAGTYIVSSNIGPKGPYLQPESTFLVHPGAIDLSKTKVRAYATPIQAGTKPAIIIECFDKYDNPLYVEDYIDKFTSTFIDPKKEKHTSSSSFDNLIEKVVYTSDDPVTVVGKVTVTVVYNNKTKIDTKHVVIEVIAGDVDPSKSILNRQLANGGWEHYKNGDNFTVNVHETLVLNVTLYDEFGNFISNIPVDAELLDPTMSGNDMDEIYFTVIRGMDNFKLDFYDNETYVNTYKNLVNGTYDLTYTVKAKKGEADFIYGMIIKGDGNHSNGDYVTAILTPKNTSFVAGNYKDFTLELRTKDDKLYNGLLDLENDLDIGIQNPDKSWNYTVSETGTRGIYTITIYSEKKGPNIMDVNLTFPKSEDKGKKNVGPAYYYVYPDKVPYKNYTVIFTQPEPKIPADQKIEITFTLADKFDNLFEGRHDIVDDNMLTILSNGEPIPIESLTLLPDEKTYKLELMPKYPPNIMRINAQYNDETASVLCFMDDIVVEIEAEVDYNSTVIVSKNKELIHVGEILDMWLYPFDTLGQCAEDKDYSPYYKVVVDGPLDTDKTFTKTYEVERVRHIDEPDTCDNEYKIITTEDDAYKYAGNYKIKVYGGDDLIGDFDQVCLPLDYSSFYLDYDFDPDHIPVLESAPMLVTGRDKYGNVLTDPLIDDITIGLSKDGKNFTDFEYDKLEIKGGQLNLDLKVREAGTYQLHMYYKGEEVETVNDGQPLPLLTFEAGPCRAETNENFDLSNLNGVKSEKPVSFSFQCYDIYNNKITHGGEDFTVLGSVITPSDIISLDNMDITDNDDGTYTVSFVPNMSGKYLIRLFVDDEKYGEDITVTYGDKKCTGKTPILCPNGQCAEDVYGCIVPPNDCPKDKPFICKVNGTEICVKSRIECDCPLGYYRCSYMKYCVPDDRRDMCPTYKRRNCKTMDAKWKYFADGICRDETSTQPTQIVCPIDSVLCPDLTCRKDHDTCLRSPELEKNDVRCVDQEIVSYANECSSTITCSNPDHYVCNGECVESELYCKPLRECPFETPFLCSNNMCVREASQCGTGIMCGDGNSLCQDHICREKCE